MQFDRVIGHRGACGYAPENTKVSMRRAYELGVKWVEFDVMLTADRIPVIIHDETLERTTNGKGEVAKKLYRELIELDAGSWFSSQYAGERIPSFHELIHYLHSLDLAFNAEIKANIGEEELTAALVMEQLMGLPSEYFSKVIVSSFSEKILKAVRNLNKHIAIGYLIDNWQAPWLDIIHDLNCVALHVDQLILTADKIAQIRQYNKKILSYTVNCPQRADELFRLGVDAVFSDFPDRVVNLRSMI